MEPRSRSAGSFFLTCILTPAQIPRPKSHAHDLRAIEGDPSFEACGHWMKGCTECHPFVQERFHEFAPDRLAIRQMHRSMKTHTSKTVVA